MADYDKIIAAITKAENDGDTEAIPHLVSMAKEAKKSQEKLSRSDVAKETITGVAKGAANVGARAVAGALAAPVAAVRSLYSMGSDLGSGLSLADAGANAQQKIENTEKSASALADKVAPPTEGEPKVMGAVGKPLAMASQGLGQLGAAAGSVVGPKTAEFGKTLGENAISDIASVAGAKSAIQSVKPFLSAKPKLSQVQDEIRIAKENGFMAPPVEANPTMTNKVATSVANPESLNNEIAVKNADHMTKLVKQEIGIPEGGKLNAQALESKHEQANKAYDAIKKAQVDLTPDAELGTAMRGVDSKLAAHKAQFPELYQNPALENVRQVLLNPSAPVTAEVMLDTIAMLRKDAAKQLARKELTAEETKAAMSMKNVATVLEDFVDRKLSVPVHQAGAAVARGPRGSQQVISAGPQQAALPPPMVGARVVPREPSGPHNAPGAPPAQAPGPQPIDFGAPQGPAKFGTIGPAQTNPSAKLVEDYRKARQLHAKLYDIEAATNTVTGRIDPAVLARIEDAGGTMSGNLAKITHAHRAMSHVVKNIEAGTQGGLRASDMAVGHAAGGVLGGAAGLALGMGTAGAALPATALALATPVTARKLMSSGLVNRYMAAPSAGLLARIKEIDPKVAAYLAAQSAAKSTPMKDASK